MTTKLKEDADLENAIKIARAMRDDYDWQRKDVVFHRQGSPYGYLDFDVTACQEAGRLFLRVLNKLKKDAK